MTVLMVSNTGRMKVMDFGLARGQQSDLTGTGALLGTPAYMAPEQIRCQPIDSRTDQYSLGIVAYELLTGAKPYQTEDDMQLLFAHVSCEPVPPRDLRPDLPEAIADIVLKMLSKDPEDRYPTLIDVAEALQRASAPI